MSSNSGRFKKLPRPGFGISIFQTGSGAYQFTANVTGGTPLYTYVWTFGDGTSGTGQTASHTYTESSTYTISVKVTDSMGEIASNSVTQSVTIAPTGTAAPTTISGYLASNPDVTVTATLVSATEAATLNNVSNYNGLLATYQIQGGYTIGQVVIPGFGGIIGNTWGLLNGYSYNPDGTCTLSGSYTPPATNSYIVAAVTTSGTCDIPYTGTQSQVLSFANGLIGQYEDSVPYGCYHELVTSVTVWLGASPVS